MGLFSGIGSAINDILGGSSSAKQAQKYTAYNQEKAFEYDKALAKINQGYSLESMQKQFEYEKLAAQMAHQWEISDLEKAGLNPILSAGGQGAGADTGISAGTAGSVGAGGGIGGTNGNIMDLLTGAGNLATTAKQLGLIKAQEDNLNAKTAGQILENKYVDPAKKAEIANTKADTILKGEQAQTTSAHKGLIKAQEATEHERKTTVFHEGLKNEWEAVNRRIDAELGQKDLDIMKKYGVTRRELVNLGQHGVEAVIGLFKAGKVAQAVKYVKGH